MIMAKGEDFSDAAAIAEEEGGKSASSDRAGFPMSDSKGTITRGYKMLFSSPLVGWFAMKYFKTSYMKLYYTDDYPAANLGMIAFFAVLGVLIDAFTDPLMASITDSTRSRFGRRRPYMFLSAFYTVVVFVAAFSCPRDLSGTSATVWYGIFHIAYKLADTTSMIPYEALGAELTPSVTERNSLYTWQEAALVIGILFGAVIPGFVDFKPSDAIDTGDDYENSCTHHPEDGCKTYPMIASVFAALFLIAMTWLVAATTERKIDASERPDSIAIVPTLVSCWLSRPFRLLIVSDIVEAVGGELPYVVLPYLTKWVIGESSMSSSLAFSLLAGINLLTRLFSVPLWLHIAKKIGKVKAYIWFNGLLMVAHALFIFIGWDSFVIAAGLCVVWGVVYAGHYLLKSILVDVIDYDEFLTGERREGQYFMFLEFIPKFMQVPSQAIPFLMLAHYGYNKDLPTGKVDDDMALCYAATRDNNVTLANEVSGCDISTFAACNASFAANFAGDFTTWNPQPASCLDEWKYLVAGSMTGSAQPQGVVDTLKICFSIAPAIFIGIGFTILLWFPMRDEADHEKLVAAIKEHKTGKPAKDPYYGNVVPAPKENKLIDGKIKLKLEHFLPGELFRAFKSKSYGALYVRPALSLFASTALMVPGIWLMYDDWEAMNTELGASWTPVGLMLVGCCLVVAWFSIIRLRAALFLVRANPDLRDLEYVGRRYSAMAGAPYFDALDESENAGL